MTVALLCHFDTGSTESYPASDATGKALTWPSNSGFESYQSTAWGKFSSESSAYLGGARSYDPTIYLGYARVAADTAFNIGTGDFTLTFWLNPRDFSISLLDSGYQTTPAILFEMAGLRIEWRPVDDRLYAVVDGQEFQWANEYPTVDVTFYSICRSGSTFYLGWFSDSSSQGWNYDNTGYGGLVVGNTTSPIYLGRTWALMYLDEVYLNNGAALYTTPAGDGSFVGQTTPYSLGAVNITGVASGISGTHFGTALALKVINCLVSGVVPHANLGAPAAVRNVTCAATGFSSTLLGQPYGNATGAPVFGTPTSIVSTQFGTPFHYPLIFADVGSIHSTQFGQPSFVTHIVGTVSPWAPQTAVGSPAGFTTEPVAATINYVCIPRTILARHVGTPGYFPHNAESIGPVAKVGSPKAKVLDFTCAAPSIPTRAAMGNPQCLGNIVCNAVGVMGSHLAIPIGRFDYPCRTYGINSTKFGQPRRYIDDSYPSVSVMTKLSNSIFVRTPQ